MALVRDPKLPPSVIRSIVGDMTPQGVHTYAYEIHGRTIGYCAVKQEKNNVFSVSVYGIEKAKRQQGYGRIFWSLIENDLRITLHAEQIVLQSLYDSDSYKEALEQYGKIVSDHFILPLDKVAYFLRGACSFWTSMGFDRRVLIGGIIDPKLVMLKSI